MNWLFRSNRVLKLTKQYVNDYPKFYSTFTSTTITRDPDYEFFNQNTKYNVFDRQSDKFYQFDHETRSILRDKLFLSAKRNIHWTNIPSDCTNSELIQTFADIVDYCKATKTSLTTQQFDEFVDRFVAQSVQFTSNDVILSLQLLNRYPMRTYSTTRRNLMELFIALDQMCVSKSQSWNLDQMLFVCSIWHNIPQAALSQFASQFNRVVLLCLDVMTKSQWIQALYLMRCLGCTFEEYDSSMIEVHFERFLDEMTVGEASIVCGIFKYLDRALKNTKLKLKIFDFLQKSDADTLNDSLLSNILWVSKLLLHSNLLFSLKFNHFQLLQKSCIDLYHDREALKAFSIKLRHTMHNRSLATCIYVAQVGIYQHIGDDEIITYVLHRANASDLHTLSLNDLERLANIIGNYNITTESATETKVGESILKELRLRLDKVSYPNLHSNFANIMEYLSLKDIYDIELLENILRPDYLKFIYKRNVEVHPALYFLDGFARINLNGIYNGPLLSTKRWHVFAKYSHHRMPNAGRSYPRAVEETISNIFKHYNCAHALPSYRSAGNFHIERWEMNSYLLNVQFTLQTYMFVWTWIQ